MNPFNKDYYLRGEETGVSNYTDYKWRPELTIPMVDHLIRFIGIKNSETLLSMGCSRGYDVKALLIRGVHANGYDISEWAIENCDPEVKDRLTTYFPGVKFDYLYSKDCLEHIPLETLCIDLPKILSYIQKKALLIVPLAKEDNGQYINPLDEKDSTHLIRWTFATWLSFLERLRFDFVASGSLRVPYLKSSSELYPGSAGFFTLTRM